MKFFIDTADRTEIKSLASSEKPDCVLAIPSRMTKTGADWHDMTNKVGDP